MRCPFCRGKSTLSASNSKFSESQPIGFYFGIGALIIIMVIVIFPFILLWVGVYLQGYSFRDGLVLITPMVVIVSHAISSTAAHQSELHHSQLEQQLINQHPTTQPIIQSITPDNGTLGQDLSLMILGKNFRAPKVVRLVQNSEEMMTTEILSNNIKIQCNFTINNSQKQGKWDLIMVNEEGSEGRLNGAFEAKLAMLVNYGLLGVKVAKLRYTAR